LISGTGGEKATITNLWNDGGFFPKGLFNKTESGYSGLFAAMAMIMFSFGGLELIGITAAEAKIRKNHSSGNQPGDLQNSDFLCRSFGNLIFIKPVERNYRRFKPVCNGFSKFEWIGIQPFW
jgi:hypothetical protein